MAELPLWLQLNKVSRQYMDALAARLGHLGTRRHYFLLVAIGEGKGLLTQQQLADLLEVDKVAMVGILDALVKGGFVRRTRSREDRRKHHIVLTPKAQKALPEIRRAIRDLNQRALAVTPPSFQAQFPAALLAMRDELESIIRASGGEESLPGPVRRARARKAA
jgi:MarR family transcriptional regulator for hemolysin